jgi:hypothetical protein
MLLMMSDRLVLMAATGSSQPTLNTLTACTISMPVIPCELCVHDPPSLVWYTFHFMNHMMLQLKASVVG